LFVITTGTETTNAAPPEKPTGPGKSPGAETDLPAPPFPPRPAITPLFIRSTPAGNAPLIVSAAVAVVDEEIVVGAGIVATTFVVPFHPAASAAVLKFTSEPDSVKAN